MTHWLHHTTGGLLLLCGAAITLLLLLIIKVRLEPFIALIVAGLALALGAGLPVNTVVGTALVSSHSVLETGFGGILGHIAPIIGLGTVLGAVLEASGGADVLTRRLLGIFGERAAPLAIGLSGLIFGIPVFFDVGVFVLAPLVYITARNGGRSLVRYALPLLAGLSMTHAFLAPHPGPVAAAGLLGVQLGWIIVMGLVCGLPAFLVAGVAWGSWIGDRVRIAVPEDFVPAEAQAPQTGAGAEAVAAGDPVSVADPIAAGGPADAGPAAAATSVVPVTSVGAADPVAGPSLGAVCAIVAVPLVLILAATFGTVWWPKAGVLPVLTFLGNPSVALTIAVLIAMWLLGTRRGITVHQLSELAGASLRPVGMILLVVGAGAFFGAVISATGVGKALADSLAGAGLPVIVLAYLISCALRLAQGSATVAIVTTGGIIADLVHRQHYGQAHLALVAVAVSAGSIIASHVNDGGFWIVSRFFNMSVRNTLKTWTVLETILSVAGFAMAGLLSLVI